jgi:hypothetical protein
MVIFIYLNILLRFLDTLGLYTLLCESESDSESDSDGDDPEHLSSRDHQNRKDIRVLRKEGENLERRDGDIADQVEDVARKKQNLKSWLKSMYEGGQGNKRVKYDYTPDKHKQAIEHLERVTGITVSLQQELQKDKDKLSKDKADYEKDNTAWLDQSSVISTEEKKIDIIKQRRLAEAKIAEAESRVAEAEAKVAEAESSQSKASKVVEAEAKIAEAESSQSKASKPTEYEQGNDGETPSDD